MNKPLNLENLRRPPPELREKLRRELAEQRGFYSPFLHLAITTVSSLALIVAGVVILEGVRPWEVAFAFGVLLLANATEWRLHRDVLHKRTWFAPVLYDRHTPQHHMIYITEDMAVRSRREWRLVLVPSYAALLAFVGLTPILAALWLLGQHNLAAIFVIVSMAYIVTYEWMHLAYHQPENSFVGSLRLVRVLRRHHALHHDPQLMQRWNFNVTLPLWDLVRGTRARTRDEALRRDREREAARHRVVEARPFLRRWPRRGYSS